MMCQVGLGAFQGRAGAGINEPVVETRHVPPMVISTFQLWLRWSTSFFIILHKVLLFASRWSSVIPLFVIRIDQSILGFSISTSTVANVIRSDAMVAAPAAAKDFHGRCSLDTG